MVVKDFVPVWIENDIPSIEHKSQILVILNKKVFERYKKELYIIFVRLVMPIRVSNDGWYLRINQ